MYRDAARQISSQTGSVVVPSVFGLLPPPSPRESDEEMSEHLSMKSLSDSASDTASDAEDAQQQANSISRKKRG